MNKKTIGTIAIVASLVAALAVPVLAQAGRGTSSGRDKDVVAARKAMVRAKVKARADAKRATQAANKGRSSHESSGTAKAKGQRQARLQKNIAGKLGARKHRFDAATANLSKRIARLAALSSRVASAGGDVSGVNIKLEIARQHLANALSLEQAAILKFRSIPTAANRRAAFVEARSAGRAAVSELKVVRISIRDAAVSLRTVVNGLRSNTSAETVDAH